MPVFITPRRISTIGIPLLYNILQIEQNNIFCCFYVSQIVDNWYRVCYYNVLDDSEISQSYELFVINTYDVSSIDVSYNQHRDIVLCIAVDSSVIVSVFNIDENTYDNVNEKYTPSLSLKSMNSIVVTTRNVKIFTVSNPYWKTYLMFQDYDFNSIFYVTEIKEDGTTGEIINIHELDTTRLFHLVKKYTFQEYMNINNYFYIHRYTT